MLHWCTIDDIYGINNLSILCIELIIKPVLTDPVYKL